MTSSYRSLLVKKLWRFGGECRVYSCGCKGWPNRMRDDDDEEFAHPSVR
jgi:hypothetical protein